MELHRPAVCLFMLTLVAGCSSSGKHVDATPGPQTEKSVNDFATPARSGIISDYTRLKPSPDFPGSMVWSSGKLGAYDRFIIEPIVIVPDRSARGLAISEREKQKLASDFRYELVSELQAAKTVVTVPMPRTARLKVAVTQIARSAGENMRWFHWAGGASAEMEITDAQTGEPLASAMDSSLVTTAEPNPGNDPYSDTKIVFRHWAARLGRWLTTAK